MRGAKTIPSHKRFAAIQRLRGDDETAVSMVKVAGDEHERAAPVGNGDFHSAARKDFQDFIHLCAAQNFRAVAIAPRERMRTINLRWRREFAVVDGVEMLGVMPVGGVDRPIAIGDV